MILFIYSFIYFCGWFYGLQEECVYSEANRSLWIFFMICAASQKQMHLMNIKDRCCKWVVYGGS